MVVLTAPAPDTAAATPQIIDSASRFGPQRTIQLLSDAGIFIDDEAQGAILLAKRANHAMWGDFSKEGLDAGLLTKINDMQQKYRALVKASSYEQLVAGGQINNLLVEYVNILLDRSRQKLALLKGGQAQGAEADNPASVLHAIDTQQKKINGLMGELATYESGGDYTKQMLRRVEKLVKAERYLPIGQLVLESGMVKGAATPEIAADLVNNVLSISAARTLKGMAERFDCVSTLEDPLHCEVVKLAERQITQPLSALFEFEPSNNTQLDRIMALRTLLSAQLQQEISNERGTQLEQRSLITSAKELAQDYARVSMSLVWHYLNEGAASNDPRVAQLRVNFEKEIAASGLFGKNEQGVTMVYMMDDAIAKAQVLAKGTAADLALLAKGEEKITAILKALTNAAVKPHEQAAQATQQAQSNTHVAQITNHLAQPSGLNFSQKEAARENQTATHSVAF